MRSPTAKQKEAHGRLLHTPAAASLAGAVTLAWSIPRFTCADAARTASLFLAAAVDFLLGAIFSEGD